MLVVPVADAQEHKEAFERATTTIETLTGKPFEKPVDIKPQSREAFEKYLKKQLNLAFSDGELEAFTTVYSQLGLLPDDYKLNDELLELYRSQAGAYYDPRTRSIRTLGGGLPENQAYFVYLHELVHAHQDQHYDLLGEQRRRALGSYDSMMAFNFVIEGHANLVSMASQLGITKLTDQYFTSEKHLGVFRLLTRFTSMDLSQLGVIEQMAGSSQLTRNLKMMQNTPDILIKQMIDPYFWGQFYWYERASRSTWEDSLGWLSDPPEQTRDVIYRKTIPGAGGTDLDTERSASTFSETMGVYFLLRWLKQLDQRPGWGQFLQTDRLHLIEAAEDSYLVWDLHFYNPKHADQFVGSLSVDGEGDDPHTITLDREHGTAHVEVRRSDSTVTLYIEDDPDRQAYANS